MKQRGFGYIEGIALAVVAAAFLGLWSYYKTQTLEMQSDIKEKATAIKNLTKTNAELTAENTILHTSNTNLSGLVQKQSAALEEVKRERDEADANYKAAVAAAEAQSGKYRTTIQTILDTKITDGDWCKSWGGLINDYFNKRKAPQ